MGWIRIGQRRSGKWEQQLDDFESKRICQALYWDVQKADRDMQSISAQQRAKEEEPLV